MRPPFVERARRALEYSADEAFALSTEQFATEAERQSAASACRLLGDMIDFLDAGVEKVERRARLAGAQLTEGDYLALVQEVSNAVEGRSPFTALALRSLHPSIY